MADLAAGEVTLADGRTVRPGQTRAEWGDEPQHAAVVDGTAFHAVLRFDGDRVAAVSLVVADPAVAGTGWDDYDPGRLRAWHDAFLAARLGPGRPVQAHADPYGGVEYAFAWGTLGSYLPPQDAGAHIVLAYR